MRKSKYLVLSGLYFDFNNDLTDIINVKKLFKNQTVLDLERFNDLKIIKIDAFKKNQIKHLKLPKSIEIIGEWAFANNQIESLDLSNCINLRTIMFCAFFINQIKQLKLPNNIEEIECSAFANIQIESLDLSNCKQLKYIDGDAFSNNPLKKIKILYNIEIEYDNYYNKDIWNTFVKYYNNNGKISGDYKYENNEWKWYPL